MPNNVRIGTQVTGVPKAKSELDGLRDKFRQTSADIRKSGEDGAFAFGAAAGAAAKGVDLIGNAAYGAGQAIGDFIHDSIEAASDLNETLGKSQVVFGTSAEGVAKWGATTADAFGISKQKAIEAAASFGNVFKGLNIGASESAKMSESLVGLAGDLASFNNLDPTDALEKLRSGLAGESEPLRSVGVFLTEAQVKAKAMELGLADAHGELSEGAKVLARYHLILDQTKTAQGDFARTSDGLANSQRKVNAEMEDLQAELGEKMLPTQKFLTEVQLNLFKGINLLADGISGKLTPATLQSVEAQIGHAKAIEFAQDQLEHMDQETRDAAVAMGLLTAADLDAAAGITDTARAASDAAITFAKSAQGMQDDARESGRILRQTASESAGAIAGIGETAEQTAERVRVANIKMTVFSNSLKKDLLGNAQELVDDYYTVLIDEDELSATNHEISALRKIAASRNLTKEEKANLHRLEQTQAQLESDLASHGATQSKQFHKTMADLLKRLKHAHGEEKKAIQAEILALQLLAISAKIANGELLTLNETIGATIAKGGYVNAAGTKGKASGGPVKKNTPYIVGENHPEVFVPDTDGTIIPDVPMIPSGGGSWAGGSGTPAPIVIPVPANWSPAMQQQFARDAAPYLIREMRRQKLIPA